MLESLLILFCLKVKIKVKIDEKVKELSCNGYKSHVNFIPTCVPYLLCVHKMGKVKTIPDLRYVNTSCETPKFRYEDINSLPQIVQNCEFKMFSECTFS